MSAISSRIQHINTCFKAVLQDLNNDVCREIEKINEVLKDPVFNLNHGHGIWEKTTNPDDLQKMIGKIAEVKEAIQKDINNIRALVELVEMIDSWAREHLDLSKDALKKRVEQRQHTSNVSKAFYSWYNRAMNLRAQAICDTNAFFAD